MENVIESPHRVGTYDTHPCGYVQYKKTTATDWSCIFVDKIERGIGPFITLLLGGCASRGYGDDK